MPEQVLITGGTGFLGRCIMREFRESVSLGLSSENDIVTDLRKEGLYFNTGFKAVVHCAGKAHVIPKTDSDAAEFYELNAMGTKNLLNALKDTKPHSFVLISTVAVYGLDKGHEIDENYPLLGRSPYALSKMKAEEITVEWCNAQGLRYLILRLPLIYGENPPGNLGFMLAAMRKGLYFRIGKAKNRKSIVSTDEVAKLIKTWINNPALPSGIYNMTSGTQPTVREIEDKLALDNGLRLPGSIPSWLFRLLSKTGDILTFLPVNSKTYQKLTADLTFSGSKLKRELGWEGAKF